MKFFRIKNYEKYQGRSDGNGKPWIKLHKKITNDWAYGQLHDSHKTAYIHMLLSADTVGNRFPYDSRSLRRQLQVSSPVKTEVFEFLGLIEEIGDPKLDGASFREDKSREDKNRGEENGNNHSPHRRRIETDRDPTDKFDVQDCIIHYEYIFQKKFNKIPIIKNQKSTTALIPIVEKLGVEETNRLLTLYLEIKDDVLIKKNAYPIYLFPNAVNRLQSIDLTDSESLEETVAKFIALKNKNKEPQKNAN